MMATSRTRVSAAVARVPLNRVVPRVVDKWSSALLTRARGGNVDAMLSVAELQFQPDGWGNIAYNPIEGERWTEHAAKHGSAQAKDALRAIRLTKEVTQQKREQIHRKILQDRFNETTTTPPLMGTKAWLKAHKKKLREFAAAGIEPSDERYQAFAQESFKRRDALWAERLMENEEDETVFEEMQNRRPVNVYHDTPTLDVKRNMQAPASVQAMRRAMKAALDGKLQHAPYDAVPRPLTEIFAASTHPLMANHAPVDGLDDGVFATGERIERVSARDLRTSVRGGADAADAALRAGAGAGLDSGPVLLPPMAARVVPSAETVADRYPDLLRAVGARALAGLTREELDAKQARFAAPDAAAEEEDDDEAAEAELRLTLRQQRLEAEGLLLVEMVMANPAARAELNAADEKCEAALAAARDDTRERARIMEERERARDDVILEFLTPREQRAYLARHIIEMNATGGVTPEEDSNVESEFEMTLLDEQGVIDNVEETGYQEDRWPYVFARMPADADRTTVHYTHGDALAAKEERDIHATLYTETAVGDPLAEDGEDGEGVDSEVEDALAAAAGASRPSGFGGTGNNGNNGGAAPLGRGSRDQWRAHAAGKNGRA